MEGPKYVAEMKILENTNIVTICDNYQHNPELKTGWGFSCLIKTPEKNILFDTGADSETLLYNMEKLGIAPKEIDIIVLSHIHGDHTGGLSGILEINSNIAVYVPVSFPAGFKDNVKSHGAKVVEVGKSAKITGGIWSTGELGSLIKEQSLMVMIGKGLVVITGCAHPGVVNIIKESKRLTNKSIYLVLGGFHLMSTSEPELMGIIKAFKKLGVEKIGPCHCSGDLTRWLFKEEYKNDFIENMAGKVMLNQKTPIFK